MKIITIEAFGLHLRYLGCYGNDWVGTPNLDRLAVEGVVFDWHFTDQPELQPMTPWRARSVGTGRYALPGQPPIEVSLPMRPRIVRCDSLTGFADRALREIARNDAWLWIEGPSLLPPWDLEDELLESYFDEDDLAEGLAPWRAPAFDLVALSDDDTVRLQNTYAEVVTFFDAQLGELLDHLGGKEDTLLCVMARSGLPLGEHGMIGTPRPWLHDELVHVPLLLRLPGAAEAGLRVGALTQPVDLLPTFLEALGQPIPLLHGQSLWPLIRGEVETVRPYAVSMMRVGGDESWLMRTPEWALHVHHAPVLLGEPAPPPLFFVKPEDRWEVNDLYHQQIESTDAMEKTLHAFAAAVVQPGPLTWPAVY